MARFSKKVDTRQQRLPLFLVPKKETAWNNYQKKQKQRQWIRRLALTLGAFFFLGLVLSVFRLGWWLGQPLDQLRFTSLQTPNWSGKNQLNLLLILPDEIGAKDSVLKTQHNRRFLLVSLHPLSGTLKILVFPSNLKIPDTKGSYTLTELLALARVQNPPRGVDFLIDSLEKYLAVPIDGYIALNIADLKFKPEAEQVRQKAGDQNLGLEGVIIRYHQKLQSLRAVLKLPALIKFVKQDLETNLGAGQIFRALWEIKKVRFDKLKVFAWEDFGSQNSQDAYVRKIFQDPQLVKERLRISIKNGGSTPGLAADTARIIENLGGEVIEIQNAKIKSRNSQILVYAAPKDSTTVGRLEDILGVEAQWIKTQETQRADVEVVVARLR